MKTGGLFNRVQGEKRNGSDTKRRRSLCRVIIRGDAVRPDGGYSREILTLRQFAEDCKDIEYPETFFSEGRAIDTIFQFAYIDGFLTPSEQQEFRGAWLYLKEKWNL